MALATIFYDSTSVQSILSWQVSRLYFKTNGYTITSVDTAGCNQSALANLISAITVNTLTAVAVACGTQVTYSTTGKFTYDQVASLDSLLLPAQKGTVVTSGTCGSNSTVTNIVLTGASSVDDTYNGMYVKTAGTTAVYRYITDYTGSGTIATVRTTTTAVTTTETYIVYTNVNIHLVGDASSNINPCRVAWYHFFTTDGIATYGKHYPLIIKLLGGYSSTFEQYIVTTATATSANGTSLTHTGQFVAHAYKGKVVAIISATTGAGQMDVISDNTADVLTLTNGWTAPTGTVVYQVSDTLDYALWDNYLPYTIDTYLAKNTSSINATWDQIFDKYGKIAGKQKELDGDISLLKTYADRGRCIFDAKAAGIVS